MSSDKPDNENPSIVSHVSFGTNDLDAAVAFYDTVLATLGITQVLCIDGFAVAYGKQYPEFWIQRPHDGKAATVGNGMHIGFIADNQQQVKDFHQAALIAGAQDDGAPGPRPDYGEPYYGCFIRDPDGNKIEAAFWDFTKPQPTA
ncbi:MAG: VOC family protein [Granulosicoccus sp.]